MIVVGVTGAIVTGSRGVSIVCDCEIADLKGEIDAVILPGGMPGSKNLADTWAVHNVVIPAFNEGKIVAAICAAPAVVLGNMGLLENRKAVCYPGAESFAPDCSFEEAPVYVDQNLITAQGPGVAHEFAFVLIKQLVGDKKADEVKNGALFQ